MPTTEGLHPSRRAVLAAGVALAATPLAPRLAAAREAPSLAAEVAAGRLPPLAERLPAEPLVVQPVDRIGRYGGTWRAGLRGGGDTIGLIRMLGYEPLVTWDRAWREVQPHLATSWEVTEEARVYTFRLRRGVRWSDGRPFTAADIVFVVNTLFAHADWPGGAPSWLRSGGAGPRAEAPDDHTLRLTFRAPHGLLLQHLATGRGTELTMYQRAHCAQFHPETNPDVEALVRQGNFRNWVQLFQARCGQVFNSLRWQPTIPTLNAWVSETAYTGSTTVLNFRRNPYYWKVDPAGNQLPYLDRVSCRVSESVEDLTLRAMSGEIDMQDRHIATLANKAVFHDNRERGGYRFFDIVPDLYNAVALLLNQTHRDPVMRAVLANREVRRALSHAIDRREIIEAVFVGEGRPWGLGSRPESPLHEPGVGEAHTGFDQALANRLLEEAGLRSRDRQGFRLLSDVRRFSVEVMIIPAIRPEWPDAAEMIQRYWRQVGVELRIATVDRTLMEERRNRNDFDALIWDGPAGLGEALQPEHFLPSSTSSAFGVAWFRWSQNPQHPDAQEPPAHVRRQLALYDEMLRSGDPAVQAARMKEIIRIASDQLYAIGVVLPANGYGIVRRNFHNVPASMPGSWSWPHPGPAQTSQFFIA
jgi:peptide/nickel transport system substrate-binding protein